METIGIVVAAIVAVTAVPMGLMRLDAWRRSKFTYRQQMEQDKWDKENWRW